ncbi:methyl-accepting chemotaxis protein [Vibrio sp.]|nr:methyl-accepting chemotaxis protein [Vibrio sp.]
MMALLKQSLGTQLKVLVILPFIGFITIIVFLFSATETARENERWVEHTFEVIDEIDVSLTHIIDMETGYRGFMLTGQDNFLEPYHSGNKNALVHIDILLKKTADNPTQTKRFNEVRQLIDDWKNNVLEVGINRKRSGGTPTSIKAFVSQGLGKQYVDSMRRILHDAKQDEVALKQIRHDAFEEAEDNILIYTISTVIVFSILNGVFSHLISSNVRNGIGDLKKSMDYLARGELNHAIPDRVRASELNDLSKAYNQSIVNLSELIKQVGGANKQLVENSTNLKSSSESNYQSASVQREQLEMTATAMNEMSASITEVSQNTVEATQHADSGKKLVESSKAVVMSMRDNMQELETDVSMASASISDLSKRALGINTILESIKDVADQTNLLALNAAIEAARAGEQGRGFSVVADEVRNLANSSQESANQISDMILAFQEETNQAVEKIERSVKKTEQTRANSLEVQTAFDDIYQSYQSIVDMNHQISAATEEQQVTSEEINRNINEVYDAAKNALDESKGMLHLSSELESANQNLNTYVSRFKY